MKKSYLFIMASALALASVSCNSEDPTKASSKHIYAEGEAPYLRTNVAATNTLNMNFQMAKIDQPQYINLKSYASSFHKNLDMTVDEAINGLYNGDVVFYTINAARQRWNLTESNYGEYGWYFRPSGVCDPEEANFTLSLDPQSKIVEIKAYGIPEVGTMVNFDFGFAKKNGKDFDDYVRFVVSSAVTDPSKVVITANIPAGGYNTYDINFKDYAETIMLCLGLDVDTFIKRFDNEEFEVYLVKDGQRVTGPDGGVPGYTSGWLGYWLDSDGNITYWDGAGYPANMMFLEYAGGGYYCLGNSASSTPTGTQATVTFDIVDSLNPDNFVQFIVAVTFD